jgi:hypothetical protein
MEVIIVVLWPKMSIDEPWIAKLSLQRYYSLRPILLFANMDVSITKMCQDTSILTKSIIDWRE